MIITVYMSTTYKLSESKSPSTGHGWNEQGFHIMIISVYIWAQLTAWVNPSHRPQGMVGMDKVFTLWLSISVYIWAQLTCWVHPSCHPQGMVGMGRVFTLWSSISMYIWAQLTYWVNPSHSPQGMIGMGKVFTLWSSVCTYNTTYMLGASKMPSTGHGWDGQGFHITILISVYT